MHRDLQICQPHILAMALAENPTIIKMNLVKNLPLYFDQGFKPATLMVIGTECTGICKSNYHMIMTTTTPDNQLK